MVSDASPGTADPKIDESFVHTAQMSSDRACAQDGYFKHPHPTIIDGDKRSDSGWFDLALKSKEDMYIQGGHV